MISQEHAERFARKWIDAWNVHDLGQILSLYAEDVVLTSPVAAELTGHPEVRGKEAVRAYFEKGLEAYPELHFTLDRVFRGSDSVVVAYTNQRGVEAAEFMQLDSAGKVIRMVAHYRR